MKKIVLLTAVMIAALASAACAGCIGADPIVGEWNANKIVMTINDDGTGNGHYSFSVISIDIPLKWTKTDSAYIISISSSDGSDKYGISGKYTLSEDKKTLNGPITFVKKA